MSIRHGKGYILRICRKGQSERVVQLEDVLPPSAAVTVRVGNSRFSALLFTPGSQ